MGRVGRPWRQLWHRQGLLQEAVNYILVPLPWYDPVSPEPELELEPEPEPLSLKVLQHVSELCPAGVLADDVSEASCVELVFESDVTMIQSALHSFPLCQ